MNPSFFLSKSYPSFKAQLEKEAEKSCSPLWTPTALLMCATHSFLPCVTGRCPPGLFLQANYKLTEGRISLVSLQHLGQLSGKQSCERYCLLNFTVILNLNCEVFKRGIASILTLVWNPTDSQRSQAIESVSRKIVFMGKPAPIFVKCFQMLCREPIIHFQHSTWRAFLNVSDVYHKMEFILLTFFGLF